MYLRVLSQRPRAIYSFVCAKSKTEGCLFALNRSLRAVF